MIELSRQLVSASNTCAPADPLTPFTCITCGTQFAPSQQPPKRCDICDEERQFVGEGGKQELCWTTTERLRWAAAHLLSPCHCTAALMRHRTMHWWQWLLLIRLREVHTRQG